MQARLKFARAADQGLIIAALGCILLESDLGFKVFQGPGDVQDGFGSRADHSHGGPAKLREVS